MLPLAFWLAAFAFFRTILPIHGAAAAGTLKGFIGLFMLSPPFYGYIITENGYKVKQKGYKINYFLTKNIDAITQKGYNKKQG